VEPHKQTLIDLQYRVEKLKADGHEVLIFMDANQSEEQVYQAQAHDEKFVTHKGFMWTNQYMDLYKTLSRTVG
jgi:hypothetical protein